MGNTIADRGVSLEVAADDQPRDSGNLSFHTHPGTEEAGAGGHSGGA